MNKYTFSHVDLMTVHEVITQMGKEEESPRFLQETRDGDAPTWLQEKMSEYQPAFLSQAINLLVHFTMTECGFQCEEGGEGPPSGWRDTITTFHYTCPALPGLWCVLLLETKAELKEIMGCFPKLNEEIDVTVSLVMKDYVRDTKCSPVTYEDLVNVSQLATTLRDKLIHPLQASAHRFLGVLTPRNLDLLPHELLIKIGNLLSPRDVLALGITCRKLQCVMNDNPLWMSLFKRDFR